MHKKYIYSGIVTALFLAILVTTVSKIDFSNTNIEATALRALPIENTSTNMTHVVDANLFSNKTTEENRTVIDVRTPQEFAAGHLEKATNIDFYDPSFTEKLDVLDKSQPISIYCRSGNRSGQALQTMISLGFTDVIDLEGGVQAWVNSGKTLCTEC